MSCWIVSKKHIDLLVAAALKAEMDGVEPDALGAMLWEENHKSYNYRYSHHGAPTTAKPYKFVRPHGAVDPVVVLKQIACYAYQSCEHEGWNESKAHQFCEDLKDAMILMLPGYDAAPWGIDN